MITVKDIYWIAAFLEGEGCFGFYKSRNNSYPIIQLSSTDQDVLYKAKSILGGPTNITINKKIEGNKVAYMYRVCGNLSIQWMMTIYSLMGARRKDKIKEILSKWYVYEYKGKGGDQISNSEEYQLKELLKALQSQGKNITLDELKTKIAGNNATIQ